jgi:hypothetical protein
MITLEGYELILSFSGIDFLDIFVQSMRTKDLPCYSGVQSEPGDLVLVYENGIYLKPPTNNINYKIVPSFEYPCEGPESWHEYLGWNEGMALLSREYVTEVLRHVDTKYQRMYIKVIREGDEFDFTTISKEEYSVISMMGFNPLPPKSWKDYA